MDKLWNLSSWEFIYIWS